MKNSTVNTLAKIQLLYSKASCKDSLYPYHLKQRITVFAMMQAKTKY
jgi:hypothetical protein